MITTEAWVLEQGSRDSAGPAELQLQQFSFAEITSEEVLVEPIFGSWEANMTHAIQREPVDICRLRREPKVVMGNAGVMRILQTGADVTNVREGDLCMLLPIGTMDQWGYTIKVVGYDAVGSIGLLAKRTKLHYTQVLAIPKNTRRTLQQWAATPIRYGTAWANWKQAYGSWLLQMSQDDCPRPYVWGWGGGVSLAELTLAKFDGCETAMIVSTDERMELARRMGITPIDRRQFADLNFDAVRYDSDRAYRIKYLAAESKFLDIVKELTGGQGVSIFIDNIGTPVFRATLRALGRQGVVTTSGWKHGMNVSVQRAAECVAHHTHVHTHGTRHCQAATAMLFGEQTGWMPPIDGSFYTWGDVPRLAADYAADRVGTYFPIYQINEL